LNNNGGYLLLKYVPEIAQKPNQTPLDKEEKLFPKPNAMGMMMENKLMSA
jgi:hypothetical protein